MEKSKIISKKCPFCKHGKMSPTYNYNMKSILEWRCNNRMCAYHDQADLAIPHRHMLLIERWKNFYDDNCLNSYIYPTKKD